MKLGTAAKDRSQAAGPRQRLEGATGTLSTAELDAKLQQGLSGIDSGVAAVFGGLLSAGAYMPMLLRVTPRLVTPVAEGDYFAHEQVATWGIDSFWGLPETHARLTTARSKHR